MLRAFLCGSPFFVDESVGCFRGSVFRLAGSSPDPREGVSLIRDLEPDIVIVDHDAGGLDGAIFIARSCPGVLVFLATDRPSLDLSRRAAARGVRGVLKKPLDMREIVRAVEVAQSEEGKRGRERADQTAEFQPFGAPPRQEVIVIYSPKGGVGKTTIAVNLAATYLNGEQQFQPVVVDFDVNANVAAMLQLPNGPSIADWADLAGEDGSFDLQVIDGLIAKHPSGLAVVPGLKKQTDADVLTSELAETVLSTLRAFFDVVVIDLGPVLNDASVVAFDQATRIYIVGTLDVPTLRLINDTAQVLDTLGIDDSKARLVLNRVPKKPDISVRDVADLLAYPMIGKIPEEPSIQGCINRGEIMTLMKPDSPFSREVRRLGSAGEARAGVRKMGLFGRLFARRATA